MKLVKELKVKTKMLNENKTTECNKIRIAFGTAVPISEIERFFVQTTCKYWELTI